MYSALPLPKPLYSGLALPDTHQYIRPRCNADLPPGSCRTTFARPATAVPSQKAPSSELVSYAFRPAKSAAQWLAGRGLVAIIIGATGCDSQPVRMVCRETNETGHVQSYFPWSHRGILRRTSPFPSLRPFPLPLFCMYSAFQPSLQALPRCSEIARRSQGLSVQG